MATVGDRLKEARKERKLTQQALAALSGVGQSTISEIENGRNRAPGGHELYELAKALEVRLVWFFDPREPKYAPPHCNRQAIAQLYELSLHWGKCSPKTREHVLGMVIEAAHATEEAGNGLMKRVRGTKSSKPIDTSDFAPIVDE